MLVIRLFLKFLSYAALMASEARKEQSETIVCQVTKRKKNHSTSLEYFIQQKCSLVDVIKFYY